MHSNARDFSDEALNDAWRKLVGKSGNPVPNWESEQLVNATKEQLEKYATSCERFLTIARDKAADTNLNSDLYWTAASYWWETRIEAIQARASRAQAVPLPRWRERGQRFEPYIAGPPGCTAKKTGWMGQTTMPSSSTVKPKPSLPTPRQPLATSYDGESWAINPKPTSPTYSQLTKDEDVINEKNL